MTVSYTHLDVYKRQPHRLTSSLRTSSKATVPKWRPVKPCQRTTPVSYTHLFRAKTVPPQTTRAKLRGDFVRVAQAHRRDFSVDWVHLKLNDQTQRTILCKDPFTAIDERVDRLIESMQE